MSAQTTNEQLAAVRIAHTSPYFMSRFVKHASARGIRFASLEHAGRAASVGKQLVEDGRVRPILKHANERMELVLDKDDYDGMAKVSHLIDLEVDAELAARKEQPAAQAIKP